MDGSSIAGQGCSRQLRLLFVVNGDGRGHMTQALALAYHLRSAGHSVVRVLIGDTTRGIPDYFRRSIGAPLTSIPNPELVRDCHNRSVRLVRSFAYNLKLVRKHRAGIQDIRRHIECERPDIVVNFYHVLAGLYSILQRPTIPMISLGHQYLLLHPGFTTPKQRAADLAMLKLFTRITAGRSERRLALSYYPLPDAEGAKIYAVPPVLRHELFEVEAGEQSEILLVYLLNEGYLRDVADWHRSRPGTDVHCFISEEVAGCGGNGLQFHRLDDAAFLSIMARSKAVVCTAGFETICEAFYLKKPTLAVPVKGHIEQQVNAWDAEKAGAAVQGTFSDLDSFLERGPTSSQRCDLFRAWVEQAASKIVGHIEAVA